MSKDKDNTSALRVNKGIQTPSTVNKEGAKKFIQKKTETLSLNEFVNGILSGNRIILSRAITLVESALPQHYNLSQKIIERCIHYSGNSVRIGITGVPGSGKSTFIEAFGKYLTGKGCKVAVLAIDPSSEISGGSILGDKTRMDELSKNQDAFIRPSPSSGASGGVGGKTRECIILCESAGFDTIIVETIGVGQSETVVNSLVDFFLLLMITGAGDELQGIKRGIMEMADTIVINKADGDNIGKAGLAKTEFQNALHLFSPTKSGWTPLVETCSSIANTGIEHVWEIICNYVSFTKQNGYFYQKRKEQSKYGMIEMIHDSLKEKFYFNTKVIKKLPVIEKELFSQKISSYSAARKLLNVYFKSLGKK